MHPIVYDDIDEELTKKAAIRKRGSGPSGVDADGWRRIIVSSCYGAATSDLRKAIAELLKNLCITNISNNNDYVSLKSLVACRLIPLNKNSGLKLERYLEEYQEYCNDDQQARCHEGSSLTTSFCWAGSWC